MRSAALLLLAGLVLAATPPAVAQDDEAVYYMTQHKIQPSRMDSLITLTSELDIPWHNFVAENVDGYQRYFMRHDTGNEYNFMVVTRYPDWDTMDSVPYDELFPQFAASMGTEPDALDEKYRPGFEWAYEGAQHMDQIWRPVASTGQNADPSMLQDVVIYVSQYKINPQRVDSLAALVNAYDVGWHGYVAENVEGYERHWMRHDTGNEFNFLIATVYPSWDMVDDMPYEELFPEFVASMGMTVAEAEAMGVQERFQWAFEGAEHIDQIWRPAVTDGGATDQAMNDAETMEED